jgi:hypothetical protein
VEIDGCGHVLSAAIAHLACIAHDVGRNKAVTLPEQRKPGRWFETPCNNSADLRKAEVPAALGFARSGLQRVRNTG